MNISLILEYVAYIEGLLEWEIYGLPAYLPVGVGSSIILLLILWLLQRMAKESAVEERPEAQAAEEHEISAAEPEQTAAAAASAHTPAPEPAAEPVEPQLEEPTPPPPAEEAVRPGPLVEPAPFRVPKPAPPAEAVEEMELEPPEGLFARLRKGLSKTSEKLGTRINELLSSGRKIDDDLFNELEEVLITSDVGVKTTHMLLEKMRTEAERRELKNADALKDRLKQSVSEILGQVEKPLAIPHLDRPYVLMVTGVNGTGKTTTIGKLALRLKKEGKNVLLAAADTFRAAAIEQLEIWGQRSGCEVIKHKEGADPSAVAFDAIKAAQSRAADVVIIDTAGRLHTKVNLMEEMKNVKRIVGRELPGAPDEILLVLDATTGQNAMQQARQFNEALEITGLIMTKLDGTAKGGIIVGISHELQIPIRFIGVGEKIYDLQEFRADSFVNALFN